MRINIQSNADSCEPQRNSRGLGYLFMVVRQACTTVLEKMTAWEIPEELQDVLTPAVVKEVADLFAQKKSAYAASRGGLMKKDEVESINILERILAQCLPQIMKENSQRTMDVRNFFQATFNLID